MKNDDDDLFDLQKIPGKNFLIPVIGILLLAFFLLNTLRIGKISAEEVGLLLNKITGKITKIQEAGMQFYLGFTHEFFILDKRIQILEMSADLNNDSDRMQKDDLKIKTIDGSDVYVDIVVQFRIDPNMADVVLQTSGPGDQFKSKWTRDYVRTVVRHYLGELTTEEFYDSSKRDDKLKVAETETNALLNKFGIIIERITTPKKPHFYEEYEEMIKKKTVAEQIVLEEQSKALAAKQKQQTLIVEETNKKNVAVEQFSGSMQQKIIGAQAEAEKAKQSADAYFDKVTIGAEAYLYQMKQNAEGVLAAKKAEAMGIEALKLALEGEGGRNMVKMEYAKKLKNVQFTGKPFTVDSRTERFEHLSDAAASKEVIKKEEGVSNENN